MGCGAVSSKSQAQPSSQALSLNRIYQRLSLLGAGTFGKVYLCRNNLNGGLFALKVVDITAKTREEAVRQVQTLKGQIRVLRKLSHPRIVHYYSFDISPDNRQVQIVLEYAQNGSLKQLLSKQGVLTQKQAAAKTQQVLEGLSYLHSQRIVHRDLKCANILVMADGSLKITDFGTAKKIEGSSVQDIAKECASLKGTPYYMAPQILRRTGHSISADVWSLGCLVIEMLTGRAPYTVLTQDFEEIIGYIVTGVPPPLPKARSEECKDFLNCCLKTVPSQRPSSQQLLEHPWIKGNKLPCPRQVCQQSEDTKLDHGKKDQLLSGSRNESKEAKRGQSGAGRRDKMGEIEAYMRGRAEGKKEGKKEGRKEGKEGVRTSAKPKKERTANHALVSEPKLLKRQEELEEVLQIENENCLPLTRQLFPSIELSGTNTSSKDKPLLQLKNSSKAQARNPKSGHFSTTPHVKLPEAAISQPQYEQPYYEQPSRQAELYEHEQPQPQPQQSIHPAGQLSQTRPMPASRNLLYVQQVENLDVDCLPTESSAHQLTKEKVIDTMISREERNRYLQQQRAVQEQREEERRRWQRELKEGANYLKRQLSSRYMP